MLSNELNIGILGSGQLGRMMFPAAVAYGYRLKYFGSQSGCIDSLGSDFLTQGSLQDENHVYEFGKQFSIVTVEIENINLKALERLENSGIKVFPSFSQLKITKNKAIQKAFLKEQNIPTADFKIFSKEEILKRLKSGEVFSGVLKVAEGGFDGRGVLICDERSQGSIHEFVKADEKYVFEEIVPVEKELAIILARSNEGQIKIFDPVEMVFDPGTNQLDHLKCPAEISPSHLKEIVKIGERLVDRLKVVGLLAIEFFLNKSGKVLVNEMALRPHNSGHHTLDACVTSQFEQHFRAVTGMSLGETRLHSHCLTYNLVGDENAHGSPDLDFMKNLMQYGNVKLHWYAKNEVRPFRKMGHLTLLGKSHTEISKTAKEIQPWLKIKSK